VIGHAPTPFDKIMPCPSQVKSTLQTSDLQMIGAACAVLALHEGTALDQIESSVSFATFLKPI
jgi:hypothetical protein